MTPEQFAVARKVVPPVVRSMLRRDQVDDAIQDTYARLMSARFDPAKGRYSGFVATIARHVAIDMIRSDKWLLPLRDTDLPPTSQESHLIAVNFIRQARPHVADPRDWVALVMLSEGATGEEAGEAIGLSAAQMYVRVCRTRKRLMKVMR